MIRNYCGTCGAAHTSFEGHQHCTACGKTDWNNAVAVAVCVQPVIEEDGRVGLLVARRAIEPRKGTWCLIAGHIEYDETVEEGAAREMAEETSFVRARLLTGPRIRRSYNNGKGHLLIETECPPVRRSIVDDMKPCGENDAFDVIFEPAALGFPIHTEIAEQFFAKLPVTVAVT